MKLCDLTPLALAAMANVHRASGFDYQFPEELDTPLFPVKRAVVDENGEPIAAAALKVEVEAYLWMDHTRGTAEDRMIALAMLNEDLAKQARVIGFDQAHCVLPPEIAARFGARLEALGWKPARPWPLYTFQLR
jgi:hypothetical protein